MSFNIESARSNHLSIDKQKYDFILLQEHWLWNFEADDIGELFPDHNYLIKCADEDDYILNNVRKHGKHGTAILWKKCLSHLVETHTDGSDRMNVITLKCSPMPCAS